MNKHIYIPLLLLFSLFSLNLRAENITIAAGAGYKRPLVDIANEYEKKTGKHIDAVFGNMHQIISQTKMSGNVSVIFGDKTFFDQSGINFSGYYPVGNGNLVLAWRKGLHVTSIEEIRNKEITRIGIPDANKAVYGRAATEYLKNSGSSSIVAQKLITVATVPQVSAYLVSGEIDCGFINITDAIGIQDKIGGYLAADKSLYTPILIQGGVVSGFENQPDVKTFLKFLYEKESMAILRHYGI
jgi:molybdate transport system substrate-binding protein